MENNKGEGNKRMYVGLIVLLLAINIGALYLLYSENQAKRDVGEEKIALEQSFKALSDTLALKSSELEFLKGRGVEMDSVIVAQQQEMENQKKAIANLLSKNRMSNAEISKAKALIANYESSLADMKGQIEVLLAEKRLLTEQNQRLSSDLDAEKLNASQLSEQNKGLSRKVELGSLLQLRNVTVAGIKKKSNGSDAEVSRLKQIESLRIAFETGDNKVLEPGNLSLYIRIINPKGETVSVADQGSGTIKSGMNGATIQYTKKADIDWNQSNKKVSVYWGQNINDAGNYKVEIYQSGYIIGEGQVSLK